DSNTINILLSNGNGTFKVKPTLDASNKLGDGVSRVAVGVLNRANNTHVDLAAVNFNSNNVSVFLGNGNGTFTNASNFDLHTPTTTHPAATQPYPVPPADFNHDAKIDLATANQAIGSVSIYLGNADGTFVLPYTAGNVGPEPYDLTTADLNGDGNLDIVTADN